MLCFRRFPSLFTKERDADRAERDVTDAVRAWFMKTGSAKNPGKGYRGNPHGIRVRLKDYFVDGFIGLSHLR